MKALVKILLIVVLVAVGSYYAYLAVHARLEEREHRKTQDKSDLSHRFMKARDVLYAEKNALLKNFYEHINCTKTLFPNGIAELPTPNQSCNTPLNPVFKDGSTAAGLMESQHLKIELGCQKRGLQVRYARKADFFEKELGKTFKTYEREFGIKTDYFVSGTDVGCEQSPTAKEIDDLNSVRQKMLVLETDRTSYSRDKNGAYVISLTVKNKFGGPNFLLEPASCFKGHRLFTLSEAQKGTKIISAKKLRSSREQKSHKYPLPTLGVLI